MAGARRARDGEWADADAVASQQGTRPARPCAAQCPHAPPCNSQGKPAHLVLLAALLARPALHRLRDLRPVDAVGGAGHGVDGSHQLLHLRGAPFPALLLGLLRLPALGQLHGRAASAQELHGRAGSGLWAQGRGWWTSMTMHPLRPHRPLAVRPGAWALAARMQLGLRHAPEGPQPGARWLRGLQAWSARSAVLPGAYASARPARATPRGATYLPSCVGGTVGQGQSAGSRAAAPQ